MTKKEIEIWQVAAFKETYASFPEGPLIPSDRPDVLVDTTSGLLGIEVTEVYHEYRRDRIPLQEAERYRQRLVEDAQKMHAAAGGPVLDVSVMFDTNHAERVSGEQSKAISKALAQCVLAARFQRNGYTWIESGDSSQPPVPQRIAAISVLQLDAITTRFWHASQSAALPRLTAALLQKRIEEKNSKRPGYATSVHELWLLLIVNSRGLSTTFAIWEDDIATLSSHLFRSYFDRTFLFGHRNGQYWELNNAQP